MNIGMIKQCEVNSCREKNKIMEIKFFNNFLLIVLLSVTTFSEVSTLKMLSSKENFSEFDPDTSEATLKGNYEAELSEMTVCWRFFQYRRPLEKSRRASAMG